MVSSMQTKYGGKRTYMCISDYWLWDWWAREESVAPAAVPQAGSAVRHLDMCSVLRSGREVGIGWFCRKREDLPEWGSKLFCVLPFPLLCCVSDEVVFTCFGLALLLALGFCRFCNRNKVSMLMTINRLQQLLFIAVTFLLSRLKEICLFTIQGVFFTRYIRGIFFSLAVCKACLPWDVYEKTIMLRAVHN